MKVYLAGAITGLTYDGANDWREYAIQKLERAVITPLNPLRAKEFLRDYGELRQNYHSASPLSTGKGIVTRDRFDVHSCDVVLMNLRGATERSIGTLVEVGWADAWRKPIIVVLDKKNSIYDHEFIKEIAGYIVYDLDEAIEICYAIAGVEPKELKIPDNMQKFSIPRLGYHSVDDDGNKYGSEPVGTDTKVPVNKYDC